MRLKLKNLIVLMGVLGFSQSIIYGTQMTLNYDGENHIYDKPPITFYVNNQIIESATMPPVQIDNFVLVPTREVFHAMGANVQWKSVEKKVYIETKDSLIVLSLNSSEVWVNGEIKMMDTVPKVINNKIMLPIRFIGEALGFKVDWLGGERTVYITEPIFDNDDINNGNSVSENNVETMMSEEELGAENNQGIVNGTLQGIAINTLNEQLPFLDYDEMTQTLMFSEALPIHIEDIIIDDIYTKNKIVITINNAHLEEIVEGSWEGVAGYLKGVEVIKTDANVQIIIETSTLCATTTFMNEEQIAISFMKPKEKYEKIIVIDSGHGGSDNGTSANGVNEKDLTLAYGKALCKLLESNEEIKVYATRPEDAYATEGDGIIGKQYPTLDMRVKLSNEISPDLYISIHINSYVTTAPNGVETYYFASSDNRGEIFAKMVQDALISEFNMTNRKAKHGDLQVIRETNDPAILIEAGFISNINDFGIITAPDYPERFAQVVYNCILEYYNGGFNK